MGVVVKIVKIAWFRIGADELECPLLYSWGPCGGAMVGPCGGQDQDWSTWMARTASAMLCFLVVLSIVIVDKSAEKVWKILI